jgi:hypothetical protein
VLTGTWLPEPIVWYNDAENLGLRVGTIPVEDSVYGMGLLLLTLTGMEALRARSRERAAPAAARPATAAQPRTFASTP